MEDDEESEDDGEDADRDGDADGGSGESDAGSHLAEGEEQEEDGEEDGEEEEEEQDDDGHQEAEDDGSAPLSALSPLSSLLTSISPTSLPADMCDLSGTWTVNRRLSDPLTPLLAALSVPRQARQLIDGMDVVTSIHHDPLQHAFTIIDVSSAGQHVTTLYTDGVVRSSTDKGGKVVVRRAFEEEEEGEDGGGRQAEDVKEKRHVLRGGVVRVETHLPGGVQMLDVRVLVQRCVMLQRTVLTKDGKVVCQCRRVYDRRESEEERQRGEKEWKEKCELTEMMRKAKRDRREQRRLQGGEAAERYDESGNVVHTDGEEEEENLTSAGEEEAGDGEEETTQQQQHHVEGEELEEVEEEEEEEEGEEGEEGEDSTLPSTTPPTSASPEATPSNSPRPPASASAASVSVVPAPAPPPAPPAVDFASAFNGVWSVLRNYSQDTVPLLKKMGVSWMDRSLSSSQDTLVMNLGRSILVCVDRSSLGSAELRYIVNGQWHDGMSFGGKEGKVRVLLERRHPFSISIETVWLKDRRSRFQQFVEPSPHSLAFNPAAPPGSRAGAVPIGFVVCKLLDVRVLERRSIVKQMLQYVENETVLLVCVRYLRKIESREEKRRADELDRQRQLYERWRQQQQRGGEQQQPAPAASISSSSNSPSKPKGGDKANRPRPEEQQQPATAATPAAASTAGSHTAAGSSTSTEDAESGLLGLDHGGKHPSPLRYAGGYRRMSTIGSALSSSSQSSPAASSPNPLLTFLPIALVLRGDRAGQLYCLLSLLLLACYCRDSKWASIALIVGSAFYLHYLEVMARSRAHKQRLAGATVPAEGGAPSPASDIFSSGQQQAADHELQSEQPVPDP